MTSPSNASAHSHQHAVPLWGLFLALLVLTAAEVGLYDVWHDTHFISKLAMVLLLLAFTIPKAVIVLVYFMHLKFEKQLVVLLAIIPFFMVGIAVLPILTDVLTLQPQSETKVHGLGDWTPPHAPQGHGDAPAGHDAAAAPGTPAAHEAAVPLAPVAPAAHDEPAAAAPAAAEAPAAPAATPAPEEQAAPAPAAGE